MSRYLYKSANDLICGHFKLSGEELDNGLLALANKPYKFFKKKKKNGTYRGIYEPVNDLKLLQQKLKEALYQFETSELFFGFEPGRSAVLGATKHLLERKIPRWMIKFDLRDAFGSVTSELLSISLEQIFKKNKLYDLAEKDIVDESIAIIVRLTTHKGKMVQHSVYRAEWLQGRGRGFGASRHGVCCGHGQSRM